MPQYVYILSQCFDDHTRSVFATLNKEGVLTLLEENWPLRPVFDMVVPEDQMAALEEQLQQGEDFLRPWVMEAKDTLSRFLAETDDMLVLLTKRDMGAGISCHGSGTGIHLHVVALK